MSTIRVPPCHFQSQFPSACLLFFPFPLLIDFEPQGGQDPLPVFSLCSPTSATLPGRGLKEASFQGSVPGHPLSCGLSLVELGKFGKHRHPHCYGNFSGDGRTTDSSKSQYSFCLSFVLQKEQVDS